MIFHSKLEFAALKLLVFQLSLPWTINAQSNQSQVCRFLPEDPEWPSPEDWSKLNATVGGRLIANVPLASVCHDPNFNETACSALNANWNFPQTHFDFSAEFMAPLWQNQSCDPFTPASRPCRLGNYADFAINVSSAEDAAAGLQFAQENNIRLVIKNTGHDYNAKSTGRGSLALWTHNLKSIEFLNFSSQGYNGPAVKIGAGVQAFEVYEAASAQGLRTVGGECATVGIAGGYTQGGGHSALSSVYGMGADQTLEWEVVTANGTHLIASPTQNTDLYFALSGGGGGTYGVVLSLTTKAHPDGVVGGASFTFTTADNSEDVFFKGVEVWRSFMPQIVDTGATTLSFTTNTTFSLNALTSPGSNEAEVAALLQPALSKLQELNITITPNITSLPTYLEHFDQYFGPLPFGTASFNIISLIPSGRLIPRSVVENSTSNSDFLESTKLITSMGFRVVEVGVNVSHAVAGNEPSTNAVLPAWRDAISHVIVDASWDFTKTPAENQFIIDDMTNIVLPSLEAVAPDSGAYLNEDLFTQTNFQQTFYGSNYETLKAIKKAHDPNDLFYAITAVGSEAWTVGSGGRLCRTDS